MKKKTIAWMLILLLMLGTLSGCSETMIIDCPAGSEEETAAQDSSAPQESTKPESAPSEESADPGEPATEESTGTTEQPAEPEKKRPDFLTKEKWLADQLIKAASGYDQMVAYNAVPENPDEMRFYFRVILTDYMYDTLEGTPLEPQPDFSCVDPIAVTEESRYDSIHDRVWTRIFKVEISDNGKEAMLEDLKALTALDYVERVSFVSYYWGNLIAED